MLTIAAKELKTWGAKRGLNGVVVLARAIEVNPGYLSRLLNGARTPGMALAQRLSILCGIDPRDWFRVVAKKRRA